MGTYRLTMKAKFINKAEQNHEMAQRENRALEAESLAPARTGITFKQILVPVDFSDCSLNALSYASVLAQKFQAKLILLHVVEPAAYPQNYPAGTVALDKANQNLLSAAGERLLKIRLRTSAQGLAAETLVRMGRAQSEISDTAIATGADLIVMGTHGYNGLKQVLLGGTAERVVRQSHCPVLTVRHPR